MNNNKDGKDFRKLTWKELLDLPGGTVVHDEAYSASPSIRFIIVRMAHCLCAYIGIPLEHPLAGYDFNDMNVKAHWGFSFSREGDGEVWPKGYWWYGWDYTHGGDFAFFHEKPSGIHYIDIDAGAREWLKKHGNKDPWEDSRKKWLVEDVIKDSRKTLKDFKQLMLLEEQWAKDKRE